MARQFAAVLVSGCQPETPLHQGEQQCGHGKSISLAQTAAALPLLKYGYTNGETPARR
jgi:hypothetical protein